MDWKIHLFKSAGGGLLKGVFYDAHTEDEAGVLVLCHPRRAEAQAWFHGARILERLREHGFSCFTFDFNGWGESPAGALDPGLDVLGAVRFLRSFPDLADVPLGVMGFSMGAGFAVAGLARASPGDVDAAAFDAPWTRVPEAVPQHARAFHVANVVTLGAAGRAQPVHRAAKLPPIPKLFLTTDADARTPRAFVERVFERATEPKELFVGPPTAHMEAAEKGARAYVDKVVSFFGEAFAARPA